MSGKGNQGSEFLYLKMALVFKMILPQDVAGTLEDWKKMALIGDSKKA
jgi:hypothetical protein